MIFAETVLIRYPRCRACKALINNKLTKVLYSAKYGISKRK